MSEMVERVAKAILAKVPPGYGMTDVEAREYACAAIAAMREPTEKMIMAAQDAPMDSAIEWRGGDPEIYWQAMIDEALAEK
jgi:hypothetical protein